MDINTTYSTIGCVETRCRRRITKSQTCQHDQQLCGNEYYSYLIMVEYQQLNNEVVLCLDEGGGYMTPLLGL